MRYGWMRGSVGTRVINVAFVCMTLQIVRLPRPGCAPGCINFLGSRAMSALSRHYPLKGAVMTAGDHLSS